MSMEWSELINALQRIAKNGGNPTDRANVNAHLKSLSEDELRMVMEAYEDILQSSSEYYHRNPDLQEKIQQRIRAYQRRKSKNLSFILLRAAAVLIFLVGGFWLFSRLNKNVDVPSESITMEEQTIESGIFLKTNQDQPINVEQWTVGEWQTIDGVEVRIAESGAMEYKTMELHNEIDSTISHTIETPEGKMLSLLLPDGTQVRLNSASSIRYPMVFSHRQREAYISGEVFFEVTKQQNKSSDYVPFIVYAKNQKVVVLGTQFNISAYPDQSTVETTLVEGKVQVITPKSEKIMKPGELVIVDAAGNLEEKISVDIQQKIAWREDQLKFNGKSIKQCMDEIADWYKISVVYEGSIPEMGFGGSVSKSKELSEVIRLLELANVVGFRLSKDTLVVYEK